MCHWLNLSEDIHTANIGYLRWPKSVTAISVLLTTIFICSRQFQFAHGNFNFPYGNFNLFTAVSISVHGNFNFSSRQFNFTHGNFNLLTAILITAISILLTAISIYSRQFYSRHFQFFLGNAHGIFRFSHHLLATAADSGHTPKVKTQNQKWIFKVDLQREKWKSDMKTRLTK